MEREEELIEELREIAELNVPTVQRIAWEINERNGWHELERTFGDWSSNMHREISEAFEAYRDNWPEDVIFTEYGPVNQKQHPTPFRTQKKPEGVPIELADTVIWILDYCEENGIPLMDSLRLKLLWNLGRSERHGGKRV